MATNRSLAEVDASEAVGFELQFDGKQIAFLRDAAAVRNAAATCAAAHAPRVTITGYRADGSPYRTWPMTDLQEGEEEGAATE